MATEPRHVPAVSSTCYRDGSRRRCRRWRAASNGPTLASGANRRGECRQVRTHGKPGAKPSALASNRRLDKRNRFEGAADSMPDITMSASTAAIANHRHT